VGLLLTAIAAVVSTVWLAAVLAGQFDPAGDVLAKCLVGAAAFVGMPAGVTLMAVGAGGMMRGRAYPACVAAALAGLLPGSPAWVLGLPVGLWALAVLGRPEVMAAFLQNRRAATPGPAGDPGPPAPAAGKPRSWWRSFVGYFVTTPG